MQPTYETRVIGLAPCGAGALSVAFDRPPGYDFKAGQWFRLTLPTREGEQTKTFSHATAPHDARIELATRLSGSAFKDALAELAPGDTVRISAAGGRLGLSADVSRVTFLVGGTGITPVRSILREARAVGRHFDDALLVYGNRDDSCVPFLDELLALSDIGVRVVQVLEHPPANWDGERGFVTAEMVRRHQGALADRPFVVAGPPVMVEAMERVLDELGVGSERRLVERYGVSDRGGTPQ